MIKRILTSIWFLAVFITVPLIILLPPVFDKYNCKVVSEGSVLSEQNASIYFEDLDSDGQIERIESFRQPGSVNRLAFQFFKENGGMVDQINFPDEFNNEINRLYFADVDKDGNKEVYAFSFQNDSLILNWVQVTPQISPFYSLPICKINYYNNHMLDYELGDFYCVDLENDGKKELVFAVAGGYSYSPRQIFKVDIENRGIEQSENTGSAYGPLSFFDLDGDGKLEIISEGKATPVRDWFNLPYNEPAPCLKIYNSDLTFYCPPVKFMEGVQSITQTFITKDDENRNELLCTLLSSSSECESFKAYKISIEGKKTDSLAYESIDRMRTKYVFQNDKGNFVTQINPSEFLEYNAKLEIISHFRIRGNENMNFISKGDINHDGYNEYFFTNSELNEIHIFSNNFRWHHVIDMKNQLLTSKVNLFVEQNRFNIVTTKRYLTYSFITSPYYFFRYFFYAGIYLAGVLLIFLLQKAIELRLKERYRLKSQVHELQLKTLRNQLDPHFIYNTFNTIASVIKQGKSEEAYNLFIQLSKMVRSNLETTNEIYSTIGQEVDFVKDYLGIQKYRFKELFDYEVDIDKKVNSEMKIPKMLLQIHVENALKHGIRNSSIKGFLSVRVIKEEKSIKMEIEDNGVGRKKSKQINAGVSGIGLSTIEQIIELNNQKGKNYISQKIVDLKDQNGMESGTLVVLRVMV